MSGVTTAPQTGGVPGEKRADIKARTLRTDRWWLQPAIVVAALLASVVLAVAAGLFGGRAPQEVHR